jgi:(p)ppGpp synthase/HD superfamily hydrolase
MQNAQLETDAWLFGAMKHEGQFDDSNYPYYDRHVCQVVKILREVTNDSEVIAAAYLHDTVEDTNTTYEELVKYFGSRVADLVMEVTHDGQKDNVGYYFPRLKTKEAILIKFADRLSNLSRMDPWPSERQEHYLRKSKFWNSSPVKQKKETNV